MLEQSTDNVSDTSSGDNLMLGFGIKSHWTLGARNPGERSTKRYQHDDYLMKIHSISTRQTCSTVSTEDITTTRRYLCKTSIVFCSTEMYRVTPSSRGTEMCREPQEILWRVTKNCCWGSNRPSLSLPNTNTTTFFIPLPLSVVGT